MTYILIAIMKNTIIRTIIGFSTGVAITKATIVFDNSPIVKVEQNIMNLKDKIIAYSENEAKLLKKYEELYQSYILLKENSNSNGNIDLEIIEYLQGFYDNLDSQVQDLMNQVQAEKEENVEKNEYIHSLEKTIKKLESQIAQMELNSQNESENEELESKVDKIESEQDNVSEIENEETLSISSNEE